MAIIDKELSLIDSLRYTQTQPTGEMPSFLDLVKAGRRYRYELLIANLGEHNHSPRMPTTEHAHPVFHIVLYVNGNGFMSLENRRYPVATGNLVLLAPGVSHAFSPAGGNVTYHALTFALTADGESAECDTDTLLAHYLGKSVKLPTLTMQDASVFTLLRRQIEEIVTSLQNQPVEWIQHQMQMIALLSVIGNLGTVTTPAWGLAQRAKTLMNARFADPALSLVALATELHTSPENLCRQFKQQNGLTPIRYRNQLRIKAARSLLRNTNLPCKAIANRLGYSDLYTFSKAYRRYVGHSPVKERNRKIN